MMENRIETLKNIRLLGGKVYIRIRGKRLTMTLKYGAAVLTISDKYTASNITKASHFFLNFITNFES